MPEDLTHYGIIPELIGRLPVISTLKELTTEELEQILTKPKNALLKQYKHLFALDGVELIFEDDALHAVAELAETRKTGARGLRSMMEGILQPIMLRTGAEPVYVLEADEKSSKSARTRAKKKAA